MRIAETRAVRWAARLVERLDAHQVSEQATVIAFNIVYSLFPLALSLTALGGFIIQGAGERALLIAEIQAAFPEQLAREMADVVNAAGRYSGLFGLVGFASLLVAGSNLFAAIEVSFARIFGVPPRGIVHQRAVAVLMIVAFSALLVVSVAASEVAVFLTGGHRPAGGASAGWPGGRYLGLMGGWVSATLIQVVIYLVIPNLRVPFRAVWPGAVLAGTGLQVITLVFPLYIRYLAGFNRFGDAFSLVFLVMTWSYFTAFIMLTGAEVTAMRYADVAAGR
ncbi:MAG: YihY/virulence factor BrkB family protein [Bacillati bacterium ANGP1]|uniref:YihY/virulence factor BrkB family protein n=2 Tax=Candidatus Segetimicrobium genomatis TaxID=2569760 RepID=A0A537LME9_9BACT|nr:MAG: YihY/virulence factor BrkB family protein [Terrabacteria group bacterium ANGP1]